MLQLISIRPDKWRLLVQLLLTAAYAAIPFITLHDSPLIRFDFAAGVIHLVGTSFRVEGLILLFLALIFSLFTLLWLSASLGRLWCGWGCPQSVLSDFFSWLEKRVDSVFLRHLIGGLVAAIFSAATMLYFIAPRTFFNVEYLTNLSLGTAIFALIWLVLYLDMAFLGRVFCRLICPYGKFLSIVGDEESLTVEMKPELAELCIECGACARVCPMELNVREGAGGDCIRCGRCISACAGVMAGRGNPSLIGYSAGGAGTVRMLFGGARWPLLTAALVAGAAFIWFASNPVETALQVRVHQTSVVKQLDGGRVAVFLVGTAVNYSNAQVAYTLELEESEMVEVKGLPEAIVVEPESRERFNFVVVIDLEMAGTPTPLNFSLNSSGEKTGATTRLSLPPVADKK